MTSAEYQKSPFERLSPEIISQIISYSSTARTVRSLALTCSTFHFIIERDGWRDFVISRFPSFQFAPFWRPACQAAPLWRDAAHSLTTLSRNFDRKAFVLQDVRPDDSRVGGTSMYFLPDREAFRIMDRTRVQTMGYQPVIDSHEMSTGNTWDSKREIVAWGAGAEVTLRVQDRGPRVRKALAAKRRKAGPRPNEGNHPAPSSKQTWLRYLEAGARNGIDDVITLCILKSGDLSGDTVNLIVGRANGSLRHLELCRRGAVIRNTFDHGTSSVRSASVNQAPDPLLAACLGDSRIALYKVNDTGENPTPDSSAEIPADEAGSRSWSSVFVARDKIAVGRGVSDRILLVYAVTDGGLHSTPLRCFRNTFEDDRVPKRTSCYPIVSVPRSSQTNDCDGDLFFSGGYDGIIRLHDLRAPRDCVGTLSDPIDSSAIFSLAMVGRERIIAGSAFNGLVKVFDLKMIGGRAYDYRDVGLEPSCQRVDEGEEDLKLSGWNIFNPLSPRTTAQRRQSPVYSISRPSPTSTSLYVGVEDQISHFNFTSSSDRHPDPLFKSSLVRRPSGSIVAEQTWGDSTRKVSFYEQDGPDSAHLRRLRSMRETAFLSPAQLAQQPEGLDERWDVLSSSWR